jgi:hypothetical protein
MKKPYKMTLLIALLGVAGWAQAQKLSPGLWENTILMKSQNAEMDASMAKMQAELAKMPADQRKMMEEMMSKRGVSMAPAGGGAGSGSGIAVRSCISKEQAERGEPPEDEKRQCKRESMSRSGSTLKFKVVCSNPPSTGEGEFTMTSDKAYSGKMTMTSQVNGKQTSMDMQQSGKWLGADCGTLKPVGKP